MLIWAPARVPGLVQAPVLASTWPPRAPAMMLALVRVRDLAWMGRPVLLRRPTRLPWITCRPPALEMLPARPRPMRMRLHYPAWRLAPALVLALALGLAPARPLVLALVTLPVRPLVLALVMLPARPLALVLVMLPVRPLVLVLVMLPARPLVLVLPIPRLPVLARLRPMLLVPALARLPVLARPLARVLALARVLVLAAAAGRRASILAPIIRTSRRSWDLSTGISLRSSGCPSSTGR